MLKYYKPLTVTSHIVLSHISYSDEDYNVSILLKQTVIHQQKCTVVTRHALISPLLPSQYMDIQTNNATYTYTSSIKNSRRV